MAKPRVFVSSTYYDLKHVRASLENFVESLGFEAILSEKGAIAYSPDLPLDESCYREVGSADIFVLIIGGRYGSEASRSKSFDNKDFYTRYDSITKQEYKHAQELDIPIYILIERSVYAEYYTFLKNQNRDDLAYAHVDSVNVFQLIRDILTQPKNNAVHQFDRYYDIESWLREQWAGLFREFLNQRSNEKRMASLANQVAELTDLNNTMRRYMETIVTKVAPVESEKMIRDENTKLKDAIKIRDFDENPFVKYVVRRFEIPLLDVHKTITKANTIQEFHDELLSLAPERLKDLSVTRLLTQSVVALRDLNRARAALGLPPFEAVKPEAIVNQPINSTEKPEKMQRKGRKSPPKNLKISKSKK